MFVVPWANASGISQSQQLHVLSLLVAYHDSGIPSEGRARKQEPVQTSKVVVMRGMELKAMLFVFLNCVASPQLGFMD